MTIREAASPSHGARRRARRPAEPARRAWSETGAPIRAVARRAFLGGVVDGADHPRPERWWNVDRLNGLGGRGGIGRERLPNGAAEPAPALEVLAAAGARLEVLEERDVVRIRGAIEPGEPRRLQEQVGDPLVRRGVVHLAHRSTCAVEPAGRSASQSSGWSKSTTAPNRCRSWAIARRVRDLTVPRGHSRRSAICAWERSIE